VATGLKIAKFLGTSPKNASELLADTAAQVARNCKLYSGDLIPYPQPVVAANAGRTGVIRTLYALRDPDTGALVWLTWLTDVDIVTPATDTVNEQRFYYTGDGVPKISTYALATQGDPPLPARFYELGLPLPTVRPVTTSTDFVVRTSVSYARSSGNNVTLVVDAPHNLKTGSVVNVSGFTKRTGTYEQGAFVLFPSTTVTITITAHGLAIGASVFLRFTSGNTPSGRYTVDTTPTADTFTVTDTTSRSTSGNVELDIADLNTSTEVTVIDPVTITYFSPGPVVATTLSSEGKLDLAGLIQARTYVYTWITGWDEESIGSTPSEPLFIKEGQLVTISSLPTGRPVGDNFIRGIRLYRTLTGASDADFFRLKTLWFPNDITRVSRSGGVSTVTFLFPHKLFVDDRFKISGCSDPSFDVTGGIVTKEVDDYTIEFAQAGADTSLTSASGTLFYDVAETFTSSVARYWGDGGNYDFIDDFDFRSLTQLLRSDRYRKPPENLQGLTLIQNDILAGFVGNTLYLSEPAIYHAWPSAYERTFDSNIVGLAQVSGNLLVLTEDYPYVVSGTSPAVMVQSRLSARYPCLNSRSIVETSSGVIYATHDGLVLYSPSSAAQLLTRLVHSSDTWNASLDPFTLVATTYKDTYIASHSLASIVFEPGDSQQTPPTFVDNDFTFSAAWYDPITNDLYVVSGTDGDIFVWDDLSQPASMMSWKSKTLVTKDFTNVGAARVIADYTGLPGTAQWETVDINWEAADDFWDAVDPITFRLYVDKSLIFTTTVSNSNVFRLPAGYKSDTFEVAMDSFVRVRAVHLADTPSGLRSV
jgi:hypothetical protein